MAGHASSFWVEVRDCFGNICGEEAMGELRPIKVGWEGGGRVCVWEGGGQCRGCDPTWYYQLANCTF